MENEMKILVTGANGFIGQNLISELKNRNFTTIFECTRETELALFYHYCKEADVVIHLAGVNRPSDVSEFIPGNLGVTESLLANLAEHNNKCPILFSSSIQAELDNPYGRSKRKSEELILKYGNEAGVKVFIYRLPNVFGKWCKPNYNSVVATFCHNIARGLPIRVNNSHSKLELVYIDDVVDEFINQLNRIENHQAHFAEVKKIHSTTVGEIAELIDSFKRSRDDRTIPDMSNLLTRQLYSTYLSYLPEDGFSYALTMNADHRGSFTEFIKTNDRGQISINIAKRGITKGNHWHHSKNEKFLVVSGKGVIRFRKMNSDQIIEYYVSGGELKVLDIPPGYVHNIENLGDVDMITVMWANESYDPQKPDTYFIEV